MSDVIFDVFLTTGTFCLFIVIFYMISSHKPHALMELAYKISLYTAILSGAASILFWIWN